MSAYPNDIYFCDDDSEIPELMKKKKVAKRDKENQEVKNRKTKPLIIPQHKDNGKR